MLVRRVVRVAVRKWEALKVELHGRYSVERLLRVRRHCASVSGLRAAAWAALSPLPCIVLVIGVDLLPLEPPEQGFARSKMVWMRFSASALATIFPLAEQCRLFVPALPASSLHMLGISLVSVGAMLAGVACFTRWVGFPVPMTAIVVTPVVAGVMTGGIYALWHKHILRSAVARAQLRRYAVVAMTQLNAVAVYLIYTYVFNRLSGLPQSAFALLLPAMKIAGKNWMSRLIRHAEDDKAEFVTFHVEVFHAMFAASCLQSTTSILTSLAIALSDVVEACLSIHDLQVLMGSIHKCVSDATRSITAEDNSGTSETKRDENGGANTAPPSSPTESAMNYLDAVAFLLQTDKRLSDSDKRVLLAMSDATRLEFVQKVLQALYMSEILLLVEFVEVVVPCIYSAYIIATFNQANREYYAHFKDKTADDVARATANVMLYVVFEGVSLVALAVALQRKLRISALHQLSFVLETQWQEVQSKLVFWVVIELESMLAHYGVDFSFRFAWLRASSSSS